MGNLGMRKGLAQPTGQHCVAAPEVRARTVLSENLIILIKGCFLPEEASFICLSTVTQQSHLQYVNFLFIIKCSKHEEQALYKQALQLGRQTAKQYCACSLPTSPAALLHVMARSINSHKNPGLQPKTLKETSALGILEAHNQG